MALDYPLELIESEISLIFFAFYFLLEKSSKRYITSMRFSSRIEKFVENRLTHFSIKVSRVINNCLLVQLFDCRPRRA